MAIRMYTPIKCQGRISVTLTDKASKPMLLAYGDVLMMPAHYTAIEGPQNPSEFDFKDWLASQNIGHQLLH